LNRLSKVPVHKDVENFIHKNTASYGKLKIVLKENRYWIESADPKLLQILLKDPIIQSCRKIRVFIFIWFIFQIIVVLI